MSLYYFCQCGCSHERADLIKNSFTRNRLQCPEHPGGIILVRFIFCEKCGVRRCSEPSNGRPSKYCIKHQKEQDQKVRKRSYKNKIPPKAKPDIMLKTRGMYNSIKDTDKRAHCIHRNDCLMVYKWFHNLPCGKCEFYKFKVQEITGKTTNRDYGPKTRSGNYNYK